MIFGSKPLDLASAKIGEDFLDVIRDGLLLLLQALDALDERSQAFRRGALRVEV
jgi:hypothetical protein